jgi:AmiR/NasT family two-component response regulator
MPGEHGRPAGSREEEQRHILVVDDDRLVLAALAEGLRAAGYRVTGTAGPQDAIDIAARDAPDLALLDVRMPGMSGIELGGKLRELGDIPVLFLSAYGDQEIVKQAAGEGALGYLVKPLDVQQIVPSIEAALARGRDIKKLRESEAQLNAALAGSREVSMAVGVLMMRDRLDRTQAFELLRFHARSQRRTAAEVARELLSSAENLNAVSKLKSKTRRARPRNT